MWVRGEARPRRIAGYAPTAPLLDVPGGPSRGGAGETQAGGDNHQGPCVVGTGPGTYRATYLYFHQTPGRKVPRQALFLILISHSGRLPPMQGTWQVGAVAYSCTFNCVTSVHADGQLQQPPSLVFYPRLALGRGRAHFMPSRACTLHIRVGRPCQRWPTRIQPPIAGNSNRTPKK